MMVIVIISWDTSYFQGLIFPYSLIYLRTYRDFNEGHPANKGIDSKLFSSKNLKFEFLCKSIVKKKKGRKNWTYISLSAGNSDNHNPFEVNWFSFKFL